MDDTSNQDEDLAEKRQRGVALVADVARSMARREPLATHMALSLVGPVRALASVAQLGGGGADSNSATAVSQAIRDSLTLVMDMQREHWRDASDEYVRLGSVCILREWS